MKIFTVFEYCPNCKKEFPEWYFNDHLTIEHLRRVLLCECRTSDKECCNCETKTDCRLKHSCCCAVNKREGELTK